MNQKVITGTLPDNEELLDNGKKKSTDLYRGFLSFTVKEERKGRLKRTKRERKRH